MKRLLMWSIIIVGAVGMVVVDVWLIRKFVGHKPARPAAATRPVQDSDADASADAAPVHDLPPEAGGEVPPIIPKWIQLPAAQPVKLAAGKLVVYVTQPGDTGSYHDCRFDWSGMIARVEYNGHKFFNGPDAQHDDKTPYPVFGTAEEFGADSLPIANSRQREGGPLGFDEAKPGQTFIKIGVGELVRPAKPDWYWWRIIYDIARPGAWKVSTTPSSIQYEQDLKGPRGYAYRYVKTITLDPDKPIVRIARTLSNTGQRPFSTTHYCHNFVTFNDEDRIGPPWQVEFNYPLQPHPNPKCWRTRGVVEIQDKTLHFVRRLQGAMYIQMTAEPRPAADNWFRIANPLVGAAVTIQGDTPVYKIPLYVAAGAVCPEPSILLRLEPGQEERWSTTYTFEADALRVPASRPSKRDWRSTLKGVFSERGATQPSPGQ